MSISRNLADVLQRINALLPHREEQHKLDLHNAIEAEVDPTPFPGEYPTDVGTVKPAKDETTK